MKTIHNYRLCSFVLVFFLSVFSPPDFCEGQEQAVPDKQKITDELFAAAEKGDFETVKSILTKYPDMKNVKRNGGWTLLHVAFNSRALVEYLIEIGADLEARSDSQWTPLHNHAYRGHKESVALLLEHGADIEARHFYGATPLLSSIRWDRIEVTKFLVEKGANVNAADVLGRTPLITSAIAGHLALAKILLEANADIHVKDNNYKRTALHFAALYGHLNIIAELLKKGADPNAKDEAGKTPLDYAGRYGHEKVAKFLKSSGAGGEIDSRYFGYSPRLKESLKEGEAYAWYMGEIGYAVKTKNHFLLFSYSGKEGALPEEPRLSNGHIDLDEVAACDIMVFAGEQHWRQHNPERYNSWQKTHKSISFIYSFEDKLGRNPNYFKDVEGPKYVYLPDREKKTLNGVNVETIPVTRGSGFLVEADGLVIFSGGHHLLGDESQKETFNRTIDYLKGTGKRIDLLILPGYFLYGRIFPSNIEGVEYAVQTLEPRVYLASGSGASTEFLLSGVAATLKKYENQTKGFYPENRGDLFILTSQAHQDDFPVLKGPYLGQKPPGMMPEIFAHDILSQFSMLHGKIIFSPSGLEAFWTCNAAPVRSRWTARQTSQGIWSAPEPSIFSIEYVENSMVYSADGERLYFHSRRPLQGTGAPKDKDIWFGEKTSDGWGDPVPLGPPVNLPTTDESAPSLAADGTLFFTRQASTGAHGAPGHGAAQIDIYYSEWRNGVYAEPVRMGPEINSEYPEIDPVIAPDKSYLLFTSARPEGYSRMMNLYVSFRTADGRWTPAQSLSHTLKIDNIWFPSLSADGAYLFFCGGYPTDKGYTDSRYYWVDTKIIEELRPKE